MPHQQNFNNALHCGLDLIQDRALLGNGGLKGSPQCKQSSSHKRQFYTWAVTTDQQWVIKLSAIALREGRFKPSGSSGLEGLPASLVNGQRGVTGTHRAKRPMWLILPFMSVQREQVWSFKKEKNLLFASTALPFRERNFQAEKLKALFWAICSCESSSSDRMR